MPAGGFLKRFASELFPGLGAAGGYGLTISSDTPGIRGRWVTYNLDSTVGTSPSQAVAVDGSLIGAGKRLGHDLLFGYLPSGDGLTSAPVVVNLGDEPTRVDFYIFDQAGNLLDSVAVRNLAPRQPYARVISDLVPAGSGDVQVVASALNGRLAGAAFVFNEDGEPAICNVDVIDFHQP